MNETSRTVFNDRFFMTGSQSLWGL
jgi:hypothetical protein